jgi:acyl-CoA synthetase (NDP forming)
MKIQSADIVHKSDVGGVVLNIEDAEHARRAYAQMLEGVTHAVPNATIEGIVLQRMATGGVETLVGMSRDPLFGPLVAFGLGGIFVEALRDVVFRIAPLGCRDAEDMLDGIRGRAMLTGIRGRPEVSRAGLVDVLCRVSRLAIDFPEIEELDVNPLLAFSDRVVAVDARMRVRSATQPA